jgi:hypothetical protein
MATWRNWRNILPIGLAAIAGVLMAACSSEPARVLTESDGDAPSAAVAEPTETIASFLAGTVWIVDDIDTITPYGPDADVPSLSFTRGAGGLVVAVADPCGSFRLGLTKVDSGRYDLDHEEDAKIELCGDLYTRFFAEATAFELERNGAELVVRSGASVLRASHIVSDSAHPEAPVRGDGEVPWCADVERPQPRVQGNLPGNRNPDDIAMGVLSTYAQEHPDTFAYINIDRDNGGVVVLGFTDDPGPHYEALFTRSPSPDDAVGVEPAPPIEDPRPLGEQDFPFDVVQVDYTQAELEAVQLSLELGPEDGLIGSGSGNSLNRVTLSFVDPPQDRWADIVASLPEEACVEGVSYTPEIPAGVALLDEDGNYIGPAELIAVGLYIEEPLAADSTTLTILGTEMACNSGKAMGDRMRGPAIAETPERIMIAVGVVPNLAGGNCPSNPVEMFVFELSAPVGDRVVWNAMADEPIDGDPYR